MTRGNPQAPLRIAHVLTNGGIDGDFNVQVVKSRRRQVRFPVRFHLIAMLFIVFDIEAIFFYPWAVIFKRLDLYGLLQMLVFIGILLVGYVYIWRKGAFEWE